jgi:hypothetical protein
MTDLPPDRTGAPQEEVVERALAFVAEFKGDGRCALNCFYSEALAAEVQRLRSAAPQEAAFTENEVKDVLTALYQDAQVNLALADRVAALIQGRVAAVDPPPVYDDAEVWKLLNEADDEKRGWSQEMWRHWFLKLVDAMSALSCSMGRA